MSVKASESVLLSCALVKPATKSEAALPAPLMVAAAGPATRVAVTTTSLRATLVMPFMVTTCTPLMVP